MSAAATAAGYLYASGRLRGRASREQGEAERPQQEKRREKPAPREIRVAVYQPEEKPEPRRTPKIEYRTRRRWSVA